MDWKKELNWLRAESVTIYDSLRSEAFGDDTTERGDVEGGNYKREMYRKSIDGKEYVVEQIYEEGRLVERKVIYRD